MILIDVPDIMKTHFELLTDPNVGRSGITTGYLILF